MIRGAALAVLLTVLPSPAPAGAIHSVVAVQYGTGTLSPGLPAGGCAFQSWTFSGTMAVAASLKGTYTMSFAGASTICETLWVGEGTGDVSGDVSGWVSYARTLRALSLRGSLVIDGHPHIVSCEISYDLTSVNPSTTYVWHGWCHFLG